MKTENSEEEMIRRKLAIALFTVSGLVSVPTKWTAPIVNSVILPTHAQTSVCADILSVDVIGAWRFTSTDDVQFDIEFVDDVTIQFGDPVVTGPWRRDITTGELVLEVSHRAPLITRITQETDCVASELEIHNNTQFFIDFVAPAVGVRI